MSRLMHFSYCISGAHLLWEWEGKFGKKSGFKSDIHLVFLEEIMEEFGLKIGPMGKSRPGDEAVLAAERLSSLSIMG